MLIKIKKSLWNLIYAQMIVFCSWNITSRNCSSFHANECVFSHNEQQKVQLEKLLLTYLEIQVRSRNILMTDAQTDYLNNYWMNCETATRNLSRDLLRCNDLLFTPHGNLKYLCNEEFIVVIQSKHLITSTPRNHCCVAKSLHASRVSGWTTFGSCSLQKHKVILVKTDEVIRFGFLSSSFFSYQITSHFKE